MSEHKGTVSLREIRKYQKSTEMLLRHPEGLDAMSVEAAASISKPEVAAAMRIARFWRWCRFFSLTVHIVRRFQDQGLSIDEVRALRWIPFDYHDTRDLH
jgi:hypothetical protein